MSAVTGADLVSELKGVVPPAESGFSVRDVPDSPGYKIGRGVYGVVALLTPPDPMPEPPTRLRTLQLDPRVRVALEDRSGTSEAEHGLVQLTLEDDQLLEPFLGVAATIIRLLGSSPGPGEVSAGMRRLVKIFESQEAPRGSVLGLFGELLVIATASDAGALVDAWHARVDNRFDFADEGSRLEVKTTTKDVREHMFGLRQLKPVAGAEVRIASLMTTETSAGTSIGDLVARVEGRLGGDPMRQVKVHQQVAATLGNDWVRYLSHSFDEVQAEATLLILDPALVPQVEEPPPEVVSVTLAVDCSGVPVDSAPAGLASLVRSPTEHY